MPFSQRIVLIDDDEDDRFIFREGFAQTGYQGELMQFDSGNAFLGYLHTLEEELPSLILLDLNIPLISGMEILKKIKSNEKWRCIPVVVLTTSRLSEDRDIAYANGANGFISKPGDYQDVLKLIRSVIQLWGK